jgi:hypothetical protein
VRALFDGGGTAIAATDANVAIAGRDLGTTGATTGTSSGWAASHAVRPRVTASAA